MSVWAVSMVRDEIDILPFTIGHLMAGKVDGFIIADNRSNDGTKSWLEHESRYLAGRVPWIIVDDPEVGYYQSRKMTALAQRAFREGADWVIPFDADEIWYSTDPNRSLAEEIESHDADILSVPLHNYFPTDRDPKPVLSPVRRITYRDPRPAPLAKVIVRNDPAIEIAQGNHDGRSDRPLRRESAAIEIAHFPWRRFGQFERKVRNGFEAYRATDLSPDVGSHWRGYGEILETQGTRALRDIYFKWFHDPPMVLQHYPVDENRGIPATGTGPF
jgi:hypothetical protein